MDKNTVFDYNMSTFSSGQECKRMNNIIYVGKHLLTMSVTRHAHSCWELVYCTAGSGTFHFDDYEVPYRQGDIVVIPPYTPHSNSSKDGFTNYHINLTDTPLSFKSTAVIQDDSNHFLLHAFEAAYFHFNSDADRRRMLLSPYGDLLYCYLVCYHKTQPLSKVVEEIESNIIQNYPDVNYELDRYLQSFPFSYDYLRKLFKKELGVTPHQYLSDKRLQTAAEMLSYGYRDNNNIAEIAMLCGFREPLYFSRMFKKKFGVAPSYYTESQKAILPDDKPDGDSMKIDL